MMDALPVLWSFRRCPYAMRARLAIRSSGVAVELREILLRDKPQAFLAMSPSATVPALQSGSLVLDESLDIMKWALSQSDPAGLLDMPASGHQLIEETDGPFKAALDHTKYSARYPDRDKDADRAEGAQFLMRLDEMLNGKNWLFGSKSLADLAILPFVRQFANIDRAWFDDQPWSSLASWLEKFLESEEFLGIMAKYEPWSPGDAPIKFP